jgi:hypothetical protein
LSTAGLRQSGHTLFSSGTGKTCVSVLHFLLRKEAGGRSKRGRKQAKGGWDDLSLLCKSREDEGTAGKGAAPAARPGNRSFFRFFQHFFVKNVCLRKFISYICNEVLKETLSRQTKRQ